MRVVLNTMSPQGLHMYTLEDVASYKDYYKLIGCRTFDVVMVEYMGHRLSVFVDDEGLFQSGNLGREISGYPQPIFGNIVITGDVDEMGETLALPEELSLIDMMDFSSEVKWMIP